MQALHFRLERGQRLVPELIEPAAQRTEAVRVDVIDAARALGAIGHEPGLLEDLEVLRHGGPAHRHLPGDLADRARTGAQLLEHLPARGIGEGRKSVTVSHDLR